MKKIYLLLVFCCLGFSGFSATWYSQGATAVNTLANWNSLAGGGGATPATFATAGDLWIVQSNMTIAAVTWTIGGSLQINTASRITKLAAAGNTIINVGGSLSMAGTATITDAGAATGTLTINLAGNLSMTGTAVITVGGTVTNTLIFNGAGTFAAPQTITWTSTLASTKTSMTVNTGTYVELLSNLPLPTNSATGMTVNGALICGTWVISSGGTDPFTVNSGASLYTANTAGINGSITAMSATTFNGAANYIYNGVAAQTTGTFLPATILAGGSVTVNNSTGVTLSQSTTINSGATLTLTSGSLTLGANNLTLGATATLAGAFSSANMLIPTGTGTVRKIFTAAGSFTYPVGDGVGPNYTPITLNFTAGTFAAGAYAAINLRNVKDPANANVTDYLKRYWTATTSGITTPAFTASAAYVPGDVVGTEANISAGEYPLALPWNKYGVTNTATHTLTTGSITVTSGDISGISTAGPAITASAGTTICAGTTTTLSVTTSTGDPTLKYTWSPATGLSATTGLSVVATPTVGTTYFVTVTDGNGFTSSANTTIFVNPNPGPITGNNTVCIGLTTNLNGSVGGGTWSSSVLPVASIGSSSGSVLGVGAGTTTVVYTLAGCTASTVMTVTTPPTAISGPNAVCTGNNIPLSDGTPGGIWSTASPAANVGSASGIVGGISAGTATISYTTLACNPVTYVVTVNAYPSPISGATGVCVGSTTTLTDVTPGGGWSSSAPANGSVDAIGDVTGVLTGPATIYYTVAGCAVSQIMTINPLPAVITGVGQVCVGLSDLLSDVTPGGSWSSGNLFVASANSASGNVTGSAAGTSTIYYTLTSTGCTVNFIETVNPIPAAITGNFNICTSDSSLLLDASSGGTWLSNVPAVAIAGSTGMVYGITAGTTDITYTLPTSCYIIQNVTVNAAPAAITGSTIVCTGSATALTDASGAGAWSSSAFWVASVGSTGNVTGIIGGATTTISYTAPDGCSATLVVTVATAPSIIVGDSTVCIGYTITLIDSVAGGAWSSSAPGSASVPPSVGIVTGAATGSVTITYQVTGCPFVTHNVTVNPNPVPITGATGLCDGQPINVFDLTPGGTWSSGDPSVAVISPGVPTGEGVATGVSLGVTDISYTLPTGCFAVWAVTVNPAAPPISGTDTICATGSAWLTDIVGGGTWSSSNIAVATITLDSGYLTGVVPGVTYVVYTLPTGCSTSLLITAKPPVLPILGPSAVCSGSTINLTDLQSGGTWSTSNIYVATVDTGTVAGLYHDTVVVTYTTNAFQGCYAKTTITVNPLPVPVISYNYGTHSVFVVGLYSTYQWYNDRTGLIPGATAFSYALPHYNDSVSVTVTDGNGCTGSASWFYYDYTGVKNVNAPDVRIYPNPATTTLFIESAVTVRAVVSGIDGRMVMEQADAKQLDITTLASGVYVVNLYDDNGQAVLTGKLVKE
jgi:hypothetical protein